MRRAIGIILLILGLVGSVVFGIQAAQNSETFSIFGIDFGVSSANWTPLIVSGAVLIIGIIVLGARKR